MKFVSNLRRIVSNYLNKSKILFVLRGSGISPIRFSPIWLSPMTKVHCTFGNTSSGISPIGESPLYFRQYNSWSFANRRKYSGLSPISLWIKCGLKKFLSATLMSVSYDIPIPITLTWALTYILYWYCLVTTGKVHLTFANRGKSTVLSPTHPLEFRQLVKVHCTFANTSADFRHWRVSYWRKSYWRTSRHPVLHEVGLFLSFEFF